MFGTILENVYGIIPGLDVGTELGYLDVFFDESNNNNFEGLLLEESLWYTDGKMLGYYKGINLGIYDGNLLDTKHETVDGITLGLDVGTNLGSLNGSFDCFNDNNIG